MRRRARPTARGHLIRALTALVVSAVALAGWRGLDQRAPSVRFELSGTVIRNPAAVLAVAEKQLRGQLLQHHGVSAPSTRCYFTASAGPHRDLVTVTDSVLCGPVLFVDGDPSKSFAVFGLQADGSGRSAVRLTADEGEYASGPAAGVQLIRPDGRQPDQRVRLPAAVPPPAALDLLTTATEVGAGLAVAAPNAAMVGVDAGVQLLRYGFVDRYGAGSAARSAPPKRRLLAFSFAPLAGEFATVTPTLSVDIDGTVRGPLVLTPSYVVLSVPVLAQSVDLMLTDGNLVQRISLLTGQPSASNPALSDRQNRSVALTVSKSVTVRVTAGKKTGLVGGTIAFRRAWLSYWCADGSTPSAPDRAFLHITATVRLVGDVEAYGAEAALLSVTLPPSAGSVTLPPSAVSSPSRAVTLQAHNAALDPATSVDDVVEVPADLTNAVVRYSGRLATVTGSLEVITPVRVTIAIPAG